MSEYIITDQQLQTATEAYLGHELSRPITEVFVSGDKLPEIVRCGDCANYAIDELGEACTLFDFGFAGKSMDDGYCAWGERRYM